MVPRGISGQRPARPARATRSKVGGRVGSAAAIFERWRCRRAWQEMRAGSLLKGADRNRRDGQDTEPRRKARGRDSQGNRRFPASWPSGQGTGWDRRNPWAPIRAAGEAVRRGSAGESLVGIRQRPQGCWRKPAGNTEGGNPGIGPFPLKRRGGKRRRRPNWGSAYSGTQAPVPAAPVADVRDTVSEVIAGVIGLEEIC